jgi:hypothetical protein
VPSDSDFEVRLSRQQASRHLRERWGIDHSPLTLSTYGAQGKGPPYQLEEGRAQYSLVDLDEYAGNLLTGRTLKAAVDSMSPHSQKRKRPPKPKKVKRRQPLRK